MKIEQHHRRRSIEFFWIFHRFQRIYQQVKKTKSKFECNFSRVCQALQSDDPERLRVAIEQTLKRLTGETSANENTNLLNLISQRKSISTPDISNEQTTFSVSSTEQASSADNLISTSSTSRTTDQAIHVNRMNVCFYSSISFCLVNARIL